MTWTIMHGCVSAALVIWSVGMLLMFKARYNFMERFGLGLMGGGGILRIHVIFEMQGSPFFEWAPVIAITGALFLLIGRSTRDWRHEFANWRQLRVANSWMKGKQR